MAEEVKEMLKTLLGVCFYSSGQASAYTDDQRSKREEKEREEKLRDLYRKCWENSECLKKISKLREKIKKLESKINDELSKVSE